MLVDKHASLGDSGTLEMYGRVFDSLVEGVSLSDEDGIICYTNLSEDRIFGYERGELVGMHVSVQNTYPPHENQRIVDEVIEQLKTRGYWSGEFSNRKKDGTPFTTFARITAIEVEGKSYWVCVQEDITERKQAEEALRQSEERFRAVWEYAGDAMSLSDPEGIVLAANPAYCELYGYNPEEIIGRSYAIIFPEEQREWAHVAYRRTFADPAIPPVLEATVARRDGSERVVEVRYTFIERDGQRIALISMIRDITKRKETEKALARALTLEQQARAHAEMAVRVRSELLSVVSHDLRNPLAAITGNSQLLTRRIKRLNAGESERESLSSLLHRIDEASSRMNTMISELIDFGTLQEGHELTLQRRSADLIWHFRRVTEEHQESNRSHLIEFEADVEQLEGEWDVTRLERVLGNLLTNAVKYSPPESHIQVHVGVETKAGRHERHKEGREERREKRREKRQEEAQEDGKVKETEGARWAVISVRDQGVGIPEDDLPHIFEWFRRAKNVSTNVSGSGIGLANAHQVIEQHGGTITCESREGVGSVFTIKLPMNNSEQ